VAVVANDFQQGQQVVRRLRVLVVDDNNDVADCLVMLLRGIGHSARACYSGRDCLGCLDEFQPQVVLLDLSMPEQDGFDICRLIRQTEGFEEVFIVACSALDPYLVEELAKGCRFSRYLVKPVSSRQLWAALHGSGE